MDLRPYSDSDIVICCISSPCHGLDTGVFIVYCRICILSHQSVRAFDLISIHECILTQNKLPKNLAIISSFVSLCAFPERFQAPSCYTLFLFFFYLLTR